MLKLNFILKDYNRSLESANVISNNPYFEKIVRSFLHFIQKSNVTELQKSLGETVYREVLQQLTELTGRQLNSLCKTYHRDFLPEKFNYLWLSELVANSYQVLQEFEQDPNLQTKLKHSK